MTDNDYLPLGIREETLRDAILARFRASGSSNGTLEKLASTSLSVLFRMECSEWEAFVVEEYERKNAWRGAIEMNGLRPSLIQELATFMSPALAVDLLSRYAAIDKVSERKDTLVLCAVRVADDQRVVLKLMRHPEHEMKMLNLVKNVPHIVQLDKIEYLGGPLSATTQHRIAVLVFLRDFDANHLQTGDVGELFTAAVQLLEAVGGLHGIGIVHGDIKPDNILFNKSKQELTLLDFGSAIIRIKQPVDNIPETLSGSTVGYTAPECIPNFRNDTFASDLWAVGTILMEELLGKRPLFKSYDNSEGLKLETSNLRNKADIQFLCQGSTALAACLFDLALKLLDVQPDKRPSAESLLKYLRNVKIEN